MPAAPIGLLGGTFDPVHYGHLRLAEEAAECCGLDELRLIPSGTPPLRAAPHAAASHRLAMLRLALTGNSRLAIDEREIRRTDTCYTVDTLAALRAELGDTRPLALIVGFDQLLRLPDWDRWQRLFDLAHLAVATRPGFALDPGAAPAALRAELARRETDRADALRESAAGRICRFDMTALDISASQVRARLAAGTSVRYLLPDAVIDYIRANGLYSTGG
ncbi:MAG TPA: nicotinate-nucleotide adenylyltransferase [Burkholderiales bacterium]|nr:nicotinate-nucleotide adenylyltransferase [Burkholderiales bacterium]